MGSRTWKGPQAQSALMRPSEPPKRFLQPLRTQRPSQCPQPSGEVSRSTIHQGVLLEASGTFTPHMPSPSRALRKYLRVNVHFILWLQHRLLQPKLKRS